MQLGVEWEEREWFQVKLDLHQGYVMSPRLVSQFIDRVVRELNARVVEKDVPFTPPQYLLLLNSLRYTYINLIYENQF